MRAIIDKARFRKLYNDGLNDHEMAAAFGCSVSAVGNTRRRLFGWPANRNRKRRWTEANFRRLAELLAKRMRLSDIARDMGRTFFAVRDAATKLRRTQRETQS